MAGETHRFSEQAKEMGTTAKEIGKEIGADAKELRAEAKEQIREGASSVSKAAGDAWETVKGKAEDIGLTRQKMGDIASRMADATQDLWAGGREFVRKHPEAALGIGFVAGFMVGLALPSAAELSRRFTGPTA
jgi:ElaB/YqjD/DUF883 family membrane-anchored ribosome-binding protein